MTSKYKDPRYRFHNGVKTCRCCKIAKPITEYSKDNKTHDKYRTRCKTCLAAIQRRLGDKRINPPHKRNEPHKHIYRERELSIQTIGFVDWGFEKKDQIRILHESRMDFTS